MLDSTEFALKTQLSQMEGQLNRARDTINSQETQISRLKASNEEYLSTQKISLEEKEQLEKELRKAQQTIRVSSNTVLPVDIFSDMGPHTITTYLVHGRLLVIKSVYSSL